MNYYFEKHKGYKDRVLTVIRCIIHNEEICCFYCRNTFEHNRYQFYEKYGRVFENGARTTVRDQSIFDISNAFELYRDLPTDEFIYPVLCDACIENYNKSCTKWKEFGVIGWIYYVIKSGKWKCLDDI